MLSRRFRYDGRTAIPLSRTQLGARNAVASRIASGDYPLEDVGCPLCGAAGAIPVSEKDMYGLPMHVGICSECGCAFTCRRLSQAALERFYDGEYRALDRAAPIEESGYFELQRSKGERIIRYLEETGVHLPANGLVLEVGCGAGGILDVFRQNGHSVLGVDLGHEYVMWGRERKGLDLLVGGLDTALVRLEETGRVPSLVIYEQVLEHLIDPRAEMVKLRSHTPEDTIVFVGVPGLRNIKAHYGGDVLRYLQLPHLTHFELVTLDRLMREAGYARVAGDETVMSVFRAGQPTGLPAQPDPAEVVAHLKRLERGYRREHLLSLPSRVVRTVRPLVGRALGRGKAHS